MTIAAVASPTTPAARHDLFPTFIRAPFSSLAGSCRPSMDWSRRSDAVSPLPLWQTSPRVGSATSRHRRSVSQVSIWPGIRHCRMLPLLRQTGGGECAGAPAPGLLSCSVLLDIRASPTAHGCDPTVQLRTSPLGSRPVRGVLVSLSKLEVNPESFVRVITYFDELVRNRASLEALVRATATLAECTAGLCDDCNRVVIRFSETGDFVAGDPVARVAEAPIELDGGPVGFVWLERTGRRGQFDEMLTERMALAAAALWQHDLGRGVSTATEPALFDIALSHRTGAVDRVRALTRLGFSEAQSVQAMVVSSEDSDDLLPCIRQVCDVVSKRVKGHVRGAVVGLKGAIIAQPGVITELLGGGTEPRLSRPGMHIAVGPSTLPPVVDSSWRHALAAMRLMATWMGGSSVTNYLDLGVLSLLADLSPAEIAKSPDVQAIQKHAGSARGLRDIEALEALFRTGSLRQAAADMNLHHSSVAARLRHVEDTLGLSLNDPIGHLRAQVAVALWRIFPAALERAHL